MIRLRAAMRSAAGRRGMATAASPQLPPALAPFELERYFAKHEFSAPYLLCSSDCEPIKMSEVLDGASDTMKDMWSDLTLAYTESRGHPLLLQEISGLYDGASSSRVITGVPQELIDLHMRALVPPFSRVVATYPGYQSLTEIAVHLQCRVDAWVPEEYPDGSVGFNVDHLEELMTQGEPPSLLVINFPHNPTGALPSLESFRRIIELCRKHDVFLFSDEMYRGLERSEDNRLPSAVEVYEKAVTLAGMSKVYGMPGARMGWLAFGESATLDSAFQRVCELKDYTTICSPGPSEVLTLAALEQRERLLSRCRKICEEGLTAISSLMAEHGDVFQWYTPPGSATAFPAILSPLSSTAFCERVLEGCGVLLLPGDAYLPTRAEVNTTAGAASPFGPNRARVAFGRTNAPEAAKVLGEWLHIAKANGSLC